MRGARDLISVALQYGNAFGQGMQAAALKPADFFGNDDVLYLMEDMATGEIRLSILWEWLHKQARAHRGRCGDRRATPATRSRAALFARLLAEEYDKLQQRRQPRRARQLEEDDAADRARDRRRPTCPTSVKLPWYIDLLNIKLGVTDLAEAKRRIRLLRDAFRDSGARITENLDFEKV